MISFKKLKPDNNRSKSPGHKNPLKTRLSRASFTTNQTNLTVNTSSHKFRPEKKTNVRKAKVSVNSTTSQIKGQDSLPRGTIDKRDSRSSYRVNSMDLRERSLGARPKKKKPKAILNKKLSIKKMFVKKSRSLSTRPN